MVDWDDDGRVDIWTTNRTGPWVRLLRNKSTTRHHFLSVALQGVRCNRDAVGARLELHLAGDSPRTLIKTLRAGEGFVAQSSKRILFGLGNQTNIERLVVRWPGGDVQSTEGLQPDNHYRVVQGESEPQLQTTPPAISLPEATPAGKHQTGARIALAGRIPLPELTYETFSGEVISLNQKVQRPTLINLWASWCMPCIDEMEQWKANWAELSKQVDIVAINVDGLDAESGAGSEQVERMARQRQFPFTTALATKQSIEVLEIVVNALVDKPQPLVVPMSVLLDGRGRVAAIYRGPVEVDELLGDVAEIDGTPRQRRDLAAHFAGRWFDEPPPSDPTVLLRNFVIAGRLDAAKSYLQQWIHQAGGVARPTVEAYYVVADAHRSLGRLEDAAKLYEQALAIDEDQPRVNLDLAICLMKLGRLDDAVGHLEKSLAGDPNNADTRKRLVLALSRVGRYAQMQQHAKVLVRADSSDAIARLHLAHALKKQQQYAEALAEYRTTLQQQPNLLIAQNDLAWLLATCRDDTVRDGDAAVALAEAACETTKYSHPALLDTLAAAQAEAGRFEEAISTLQTALKRDGAAPGSRLASIIEQHIQLYQGDTPLRED